MQLRQLGRSGLKVSVVGLGTNTFGATVRGDEAVRVIQCAVDEGVTFIDGADVYGNRGGSEELLGRALQGRRHEVVLASKVGTPMSDSPLTRGLSRQWIMRAVEDSLRRLQTDYLDLYQAHQPDADTPLEESLRAFSDLVQQGKVRYIGCSNFAAWQVALGLGISEREGLARWVSAQNRWNLLEGVDDPTLPTACQELGVGIIPYVPLASGMLTGKYAAGQEPAPGTRLHDLPNQRRRLTDANFRRVDRLKSWAEERGHTVAELAIAWLMAQPAVSTVIVGARTPEQVRANARAASWSLTLAEAEEVAELARA